MPRVVKGSMSFKPAFKAKTKVNNASNSKSQEPAASTSNGPGPSQAESTETPRGPAGRGSPEGDTIHAAQPTTARQPRLATPPSSLFTPPSTQIEEPRTFASPPGRVPVEFDRTALPPTPGPTQPRSSSRPQPRPRTQPQPLASSSSSSLSRTPRVPTPGASSSSRNARQASEQQGDQDHVVPLSVNITANEFSHRMTDDQLLPTPGFVLPNAKGLGGGPKAGPPRTTRQRDRDRDARRTENGTGGKSGGGGSEQEEVDSDDTDASGDAYQPEGSTMGIKKKRTGRKEKNTRAGTGRTRSKKTTEEASDQVQPGSGSGDEVEVTVAAGTKRKRTTKKTQPIVIDPELVDPADPDGPSGGSEDDVDEDEADGQKGSKKGKNGRNKAKRLRVSIRDDLDDELIATLQPGQAIGELVDEDTMTMADLAAGPGQGRISGKAIKLQQSKEEIQRRKEEEQERRIRFRVDRETRMRGVGGQAARQAVQAEEEAKGVEDETEQDDVDEDDEMNEKEDGHDDDGDDDDELREVDGDDVNGGVGADDEEDDDQEFVHNTHAPNLTLDEHGAFVVNNIINRQEMLDESMNNGAVFEDNDDLKFTNSMSHSKRASTIRWTKAMKDKLVTLLRQHGQVYETIAKIMALYYPIIERTHIANHMRTWNLKDPELVTWALARENKLDIDMNELKRVYPGIDFDAPLPDITMYFDPNIDPSEIRAMKRSRPSTKAMTEQEKKKQARKAALSKKKQEKMRQAAMMGTVEEGDEVGDDEIAAMRRQPGLPL